ncbi:hypothetical protein BH10ACT2_BH10ACT2_12550 [soil metagenome]
MTRYFAPLFAVMLAVSTAGCGSDSESSSSEPTTQATATVPSVTEPATTAASDSTAPSSSEPDEPPVAGIEVDDDPVCQALARVYIASFFQGLTGMFGGQDGTGEKTELYFAPALAPDVVLIRTQGAPEFQAFPILARVDAGIVALRAGGFTDAELIALAASGNDTIGSLLAGNEPDLESVGAVPGAEAKLAAAASAFLADVGTLDDYYNANADPALEAAFNDALSTQCPKLAASSAGD